MKKHILILVSMIFLIAACEKTEVSPYNLKGKLKGSVNIYSDNGRDIISREGIQVVLEGTNPELSVTTDSLGEYIIENIPAGTYNLKVLKEGLGEYQYQGLKIIGGENPVFVNPRLLEVTKTTIESITFYMDENGYIMMRGIMHHNLAENGLFATYPSIRYFVHTSSNPSSSNYLFTYYFSAPIASGTEFETQVNINEDMFPSAEELYIIAYPGNPNDWGYYNIANNQYIYTSLGEASAICQLLIP